MDLETLRYFYLRRFVAPAFRLLGVNRADRLARRIGRLVHSLNTPTRARAEGRARDWLNETSDADRIVAGMYEQAGRFCAEVLFSRRKLCESTWRSMISMTGESQLQALANGTRGCIVTTPYFGNVGVLAWALGNIFRPIHVVADRFNHPSLRAWQNELYSFPQVRIIERHDAGRRVPEVLDQRGTVLLVAESERSRGPALRADFLGRVLRCYPTIPRLARWHGAPIAAMTCRRRDEAFHFDVRLHGVIEPDTYCDDEMVMREILARLEGAIRANPEQYWWPIPNTTDSRSAVGRTLPRASSLKPQASLLMHTGT